jgi:hypothetical protein
MVDKEVWFISDAGRGLRPDTPNNEPSHIHVPRPSRVMRPQDAHGNSPTSLAVDDVPPAGTRR